MSERFYLNWPLTAGPVEMTGPEARHLATVCRLRAGDPICLFNGDGHEYPARIVEVSKRSVHLEIEGVASPSRELGFRLEVAAPVPKGDRAQFLVEKLTELGVSAFVPLLCQRGAGHLGDNKKSKLERYVIEASKQCGRNTLMRVEDPIDWATYCERAAAGTLRIVAHPPTPGTTAGWPVTAGANLSCAVGPEGGFTAEEIAQASAHGWHVLGLGPRILRIETAALVLATLATQAAGG